MCMSVCVGEGERERQREKVHVWMNFLENMSGSYFTPISKEEEKKLSTICVERYLHFYSATMNKKKDQK